MRHRATAAVARIALIVAGLALAGCSASSSASAHRAPRPLYYLSLGDSYAVGFQPHADGIGGAATPGFTAVVAAKEGMRLENFGCGGATTSSLLRVNGCVRSGFGPVAATDAVAHTGTQAQAALEFIRAKANHGRVGLITVSIGGNDVTSCAQVGGSVSAILACVQKADRAITTNVTALVGSLHTALVASGDSKARIIGLTYPDVILGAWVHPPGATQQSLAAESVLAFDDLINPTLSAAYGAANFVNITQAPYEEATRGDDTPLTTVVNVSPYGNIPAAVDEICQLTYFCTLGNIHANTTGYTFIGQQIVAHLSS